MKLNHVNINTTSVYLFLKKVNILLRLYVIIMSPATLRVNPHSIVCLNVKELLAGSRRHI